MSEYVYAPLEPTNKMLLRAQTKQAAAGFDPLDSERLKEIYRAMIEARSDDRVFGRPDTNKR